MSTTQLAEVQAPDIESSAGQLGLIAELAKDPQVSADKMEQLINLHNSEMDRQRREEAFRDLAALKFDLPQIKKSKSVDGRFNYSPMDDLMRQIGGIMKKHNIVSTFSHGGQQGANYTECILLHKNGFQFPPVRTHVAPPPQNKLLNSAQAMGVMNSYGERYALKAALGLVFTDEDTDGYVETEPEVNPEEQIDLKMMDARLTDSDLNEALEKLPNVDLEGKNWREFGNNWKERILAIWDKLEFAA